MSGIDWMLGFDPGAGKLEMSFWLAGALAALFVAVCIVALSRSGLGLLGALVRYSAVLIGALAVWLFLDQSITREKSAERRAFETRLAELTAQAVAPGSALACLDAPAGDTVADACEKAVFVNPQSVAAAVAYAAARLQLLADGVKYVVKDDGSYADTLAGLRRSIAADRFGMVAHVLASRDGCTEARCTAFALVADAGRIKANLKNDAFAKLVARYSQDWGGRDAPGERTSDASATNVPSRPSALPNLDFPSAASIPPVSIMDAEPGAAKSAAPSTEATSSIPPAPAAAAPAAASAQAPSATAPQAASVPPSPPRRPHSARRAPPGQPVGTPVPIVPSTAGTADSSAPARVQ